MIESATALETQHVRRHIHYVFFPLSCSCFPLETHLQSKGKTFQVVVAEYRSNLEGCKWLHCEALKGSKEGESKRARGLWRLMTLVHWWLEVSERREEEGWCSILLEVAQTFHWWRFGLCCELLWLLLRVLTQTEINRHCCQDALREEVDLLWPSVPLCWSRRRVFYYVNISVE